MSFDVTQGTAQTLADKLNDALVLGLYDPAGLPVGALTLEFSDPAVTVTFPGSLGDIVRFPDVIDAVVSLIPDMHFEIRPEHKSLSISMWRGAGFTIEPTGTANVSLGLDDTLATQSTGAMDVTRIRGFAQGATEGYYALITSAEAGASDPGIGDVDGPAGATDNAIALFNGITGKAIKNSLVTISPAGNVSVPALATVDGRDISADGAVLDSIVSSIASVANIAALAPLALSDGTEIYVRSVRDSWIYRAASTETVDNITIAAHVSATGRWERRNIPHSSWAKQATWFIKPSTGSDEADGLTSGTPLRTFGEVLRRLGARYNMTYAGTQTFTCLENIAEEISWDIVQQFGSTVNLKGTISAAVGTGTVSAVTAPTASVPGAVTATGLVPATEVGRLIKNNSGDGWTWVAKDNGAGSARLGGWGLTAQLSTTGMAPGTAPSIGQVVTTHTLTTFQSFSVRMAGVPGSRGIIIEDIEFTNLLGLSAAGGQHIVNRCKLNSSVSNRWVGAAFAFTNCCFARNLSAAVGNETTSQFIYAGGVVLATQTSSTNAHRSTLTLMSGILFQASGVTMNNTLVRINTGGALFMDCATDVITLTAGSTFWCSAAAGGSNNTGYGVRLQASNMMVNNGITNTLTGSLGDFCFGRASGVPATKSTARAYDPTLGAETEPRTLSWTNLVGTVATTGFGSNILDRETGCSVIVN